MGVFVNIAARISRGVEISTDESKLYAGRLVLDEDNDIFYFGLPSPFSDKVPETRRKIWITGVFSELL